MTKQRIDPSAGLVIDRKPAPARLPARVGTLIDHRWRLKLQKDALNAALAEVEADVKRVEDAIFLRFHRQGDLEGARGRLAQMSISRRLVPTGEDWQKTFEWIRAGRGNDRFAILHKRLAAQTVKEYWDDGRDVPGVGSFEKVSLSLSKVK